MAKEEPQIQRTKLLDQIVRFFQVEEPKEKRQCTGAQKSAYCLVLTLLVILFAASMGSFYIVWYTDYYETSIQQNLALVNGTQAKSWWEKPPIFPLMKVHIFNYTNVADFLAGRDAKLKLEDLGPLTYKEITEKVDLKHHDDNTITYRENRRYEFIPELSSSLKMYDEITVPNIPFIIADRKISQMSMLASFAPLAFINNLTPKPKPFLTLPVFKFLWGYDDPIISSYKNLAAFTGEPVLFDRFGMISSRVGVSRDNYTVHTGIGDMTQLGVFVATNGETKLNIYLDEDCNKIDGTDGSQFPPHLMDKKQVLNVFIKNFCRKFPLVFEKEVQVFNNIPAWRYKNPKDVFSHPDKNPQNQCYCDIEANTCPPEGILNISKCAYDTPMLASFPHFYLGDQKLIDDFEGLQPNEELHETIADIHPRLAFPLHGVSRFQLNVELNKKEKVAFTSFYPFVDKYSILPIIWMEVTGGDIPDDFMELIYHSTHSANAFKSNLRYATALSMLITFLLIIAMYIYIQRRRLQANQSANREFEVVKYAQGTVNM